MSAYQKCLPGNPELAPRPFSHSTPIPATILSRFFSGLGHGDFILIDRTYAIAWPLCRKLVLSLSKGPLDSPQVTES
jgi:hypothetical protein